MHVVEGIIVKKHCYFFYLSTDRQVEDVVKICCTGQNTSVLGIDTTYNLCDMRVTDSCYRNKRQIRNGSGHHPVFLGPVLFHFTKDDQTFTRFALELQTSNPETIKLKEIGIDMEDDIFNGVQLLFPDVPELYCGHHMKQRDVSKLYCVRHMKQRDKIKIGKLLAKFKCSENEKVFKAKQY